MSSRGLFLLAALCLLQLCLAQYQQFYMWSSPFENLPLQHRRRQLPPDGYHPEFGTCGSGTTCENACGRNWQSCKASTDLSLFCYNKVDLNQTCCANGSGRACDNGYYCAWNTFGGRVWCCKNGQSLKECGVPPPDNSTTPETSMQTTTTTTTTTATELRTTTTTTTTAIGGATVIKTVTEPGGTVTVTSVCTVTVTAPPEKTTVTAYVTVTVGDHCPKPPHPPKPTKPDHHYDPPKPTPTVCTDLPTRPGHSKTSGSKLMVGENDGTIAQTLNLSTSASAVVTGAANNLAVSSLGLALAMVVMMLL